MRFAWSAPWVGFCCAIALAACSSSPATTASGGGSTTGSSTITGAGGTGGAGTSTGTAGSTGTGTGGTGATTGTGGAGSGGGTGAGTGTGGAGSGGGDAGAQAADTLDANRDRLLETYYAYLKANATQTQSNGLSGNGVTSVCDLWQKLVPSAQNVFLTLTARLQGSILGDDGSSMLSHVTKIYRIAGGQNATLTDPGSCGGGEYNRMIMSMDAHLQKSQLAANQHQGAVQANGKPDIADIPASTSWRDSHDLGGPHAPFDLSDETNQGAPRGQTQYFEDPTSAAANAPLGRMDLTSLVDPYALEMDQDYDCVHNSNPSCSYVTYGPYCLPEASASGTAIYTQSYGSYEPGWMPANCGAP